MGAEEHRFPCETCGADLRFDPGDDRMICDHCGATEPIDHGPWTQAAAIREQDFRRAIEAGLGSAEMEEARVSACPNCAAKIEFDDAVHSTECPYCATPVVTGTGAARQIKPRAVLPFVLEETEARKEMSDWLGSLWFAPNGLTEYARKGRKMSGVYTPCWTFDADTTSRYRGQRGTIYYETKTVTRNGKREQVRVAKVRWRPASGRVARFFDDVLVIASTALPAKFRASLTHWDLTRLEPYNPEYLAGFRAEAYTIDLPEAFTQAREIMDRQILRDVRFDIGGDKQRVDHIDTEMRDVTFKHILVPVWIAAYRYRGKSFRFVVNGQTGQVAGERPWSAWKITFAILIGLLIAGAFGYLYGQGQIG
ncbi:MAG: TFIIB-type zinc finger domain-containing protein [Silicimonas sp.]|nr:TFIIB-type zinc finger domain-containing protein [Silicimonas sp.]